MYTLYTTRVTSSVMRLVYVERLLNPLAAITLLRRTRRTTAEYMRSIKMCTNRIVQITMSRWMQTKMQMTLLPRKCLSSVKLYGQTNTSKPGYGLVKSLVLHLVL
ncbi:hypothetical protein D3C80_1473130 [compost metagenome]